MPKSRRVNLLHMLVLLYCLITVPYKLGVLRIEDHPPAPKSVCRAISEIQGLGQRFHCLSSELGYKLNWMCSRETMNIVVYN